MKLFAWMAIAGSFWAIALGAQESKPVEKPAETKPAEVLPSVDQILNKYMEALGGRSAAEKITTRMIKGSMEVTNFGATGTYEALAKSPNKAVSTFTVDNYGIVQMGFDGITAWSSTPQGGVTKAEGEMSTIAKRDSDFLKAFKLKDYFPKMTVKEKSKVGEKEVFVVEASPAEGSPEKMYFDVQSGLLVRQDAERLTPEGKVPNEFYFEDYRDTDGIQLPFLIRNNTPTYNIEIKISEAKQNIPIEDERFAMPKQ